MWWKNSWKDQETLRNKQTLAVFMKNVSGTIQSPRKMCQALYNPREKCVRHYTIPEKNVSGTIQSPRNKDCKQIELKTGSCCSLKCQSLYNQNEL